MPDKIIYQILIVDDSKMNRILLKKVLSDAGYGIFEAVNGQEGRMIANREKLDLILLDIQMPIEDGFEAIGKLKSNPVTAQIPIIFLSGISDVSSKVKGLESGAVDFITKPFDPDEVKARVKVHIKLHLGIKAVIENQREKLKQIESAQQQMLIMPEEMPEANFYAKYLPLDDAGGDFYSVVELANHMYGYFLGDVSGHDISTSYITAALNVLLRQNCTALNTPAEAMTMINQVLCQTLESYKFLAATYLQIDRVNKKATLINMGNPPMICIKANNECKLIISKGIALGMFENSIFSEYIFDIEDGDRFIMFSDGILEFSGDIWAANLDSLLDVAKKIARLDIKSATEALCDSFVTDPEKITDDIAILTMEV